MRSQQVYQALVHVPNRFALCRIAAMSLQKLHKASTRPQETISSVLADISRYKSRRAHVAEGLEPPKESLGLATEGVDTEKVANNLSINADLLFVGD